MFTVTSDPIMTVADAKLLMSIADDQQAVFMVNALSAKAKRFLSRVQLLQNTTTPIVETLIPYGGSRLYLHAPIYTGSGFTISAVIKRGQSTEQTLTYADGQLDYFTDDQESYIDFVSALLPGADDGCKVVVTYKGGWASIPADVVQGAVMQGVVDLKRMKGEVGVTSRGASGESTQFDNAGLVRECIDMWRPYRVMV